MLADGVYNTHGSCPSEAGLGLAGDQEGVHEGLGVVLADTHQQVVDQAPHWLHCCMDASNHLHHKTVISTITMECKQTASQ